MRMRMRIFSSIYTYSRALILASSISLSSCQFLDIVPPEQASLEDATNNADNTEKFLYSCYAAIQQLGTPIAYTNSTSSADEFALPQLWGGTVFNYAYDLVINNTGGDQRWNRYYDSIGQIHLFLRELENARDVSQDLKDQWTAEVKFLLAYYHFEILRFYGPCPITDKYMPFDTPAKDFGSRMHYDAVTEYIVKTIDEVLESGHLPISRTETTRGRATRAVARAIKARALLYAASPLWNGEFPYKTWVNSQDTEYNGVEYGRELVSKEYSPTKWERALTACKEAIDEAEDAGHALYEDLDFYTTKETKEAKILDQLYIPVENVTDDFKKRVLMLRYMTCTRFNEGNTELVWGTSQDNDFMVGQCLMPHHVIKKNNGQWVNGYEGYSPYLNAIEKFYTKDGKFINTSDPDLLTRWGKDTDTKRADIIKLAADREPRFYAWMAFDGGDWGVLISDGKPLTLNMKSTEHQGYDPDGFKRDNPVTGFLCQKWIRPDRRYNTSGNVNNERFQRPLVRMAELYLNLAECCAMLGDTEGALKNLNMVHQRAGLLPVTEADITEEHPLIEWVRNERFIELYGEGHRYFDVRRWCQGEKYLAAGVREGLDSERINPTFEEFNTRVKVNQPYKWSDRMNLSPLYTSEVGKNNLLVQAPGY